MRSKRRSRGARAAWITVALLAVVCTAHAATRGAETLETAHYRLHAIDGAVDTAELGAILEQAWPVFEKFLRVAPDAKGAKRLCVEFFPTREAWRAGPFAGGTPPPLDVDSTWLDRESLVAYVCRSPFEYETRKRTLYVACQQFHACAKTKNVDLDAWYVHGIAESFATHAWDGERLTIGAWPRISMIDHPARALESLGGPKLGLDAFDERRLHDPSVRWAAVRFALEGEGRKYRARFEKHALGHRGSKLSGEDFLRSLGRAESISQEFASWLNDVQLPFEVLYGEWEDLLDGRVVTRTQAPGIGAACARGDVGAFEIAVTRKELDERTLGVVLEASGDTLRVFRLRPPHAMLERYVFGTLVETGELLRCREFESDLVAVRATLADGAVTIAADGETHGPFAVAKPRLGVAVFGGPLTLLRLHAQ